jgi:hypothetical protein
MELVMQHRSHVRASRAGAFVLGIAATLAVACSDATRTPSAATGIVAFEGGESDHVGCIAGGRKFTGGGRVDPSGVGKVTFGFNIHGGELCDSVGTVKGQMQVVYHETQTLVHTLTMQHFSSFVDPVKGVCGEWGGTARVKHVFAGSDWHEHQYFTEVCDKDEPGRGADRLTFTLDGERGLHENVMEEVLTGGNIQAHKS